MNTNILSEEMRFQEVFHHIKSANADEDAGSHDSDSTCE